MCSHLANPCSLLQCDQPLNLGSASRNNSSHFWRRLLLWSSELRKGAAGLLALIVAREAVLLLYTYLT